MGDQGLHVPLLRDLSTVGRGCGGDVPGMNDLQVILVSKPPSHLMHIHVEVMYTCLEDLGLLVLALLMCVQHH